VNDHFRPSAVVFASLYSVGLKFTADGLNNKAEAFVILHRIAAMHHRRMQDLEPRRDEAAVPHEQH